MNKNLVKQAFVFILLVMAVRLNATAAIADTLQNTQADTTRIRVDDSGRTYPALPPSAKRLFYLQRSTNVNALVYDLNINEETGKPDEDAPVHAYWLRYADGNGEPAELTYVQRKFAYGISANAAGDDKYDIRIMSYKKFPLTLMKAADGKYHIFAIVSKRQVILQNIFVQINGGSLWSPNIIFVEMKGTDTVTGKEVTERFKP